VANPEEPQVSRRKSEDDVHRSRGLQTPH